MAITLTSKAPGERIAYLWTPSLAEGDTITVIPNIQLVSGTAALDGVSLIGDAQVKIWLIAGIDGETSEFLIEIDTVGGETIQETIYLPVNLSAYSALGAMLVQVFPAFASIAPAQVDYWLDRSAIVADWGNDHAQMLLACHYMAVNGLGENASTIGLTSFKSGAVDMKFSEERANAFGYDQTIYGQQFYMLLRRRHAGPRLANPLGFVHQC